MQLLSFSGGTALVLAAQASFDLSYRMSQMLMLMFCLPRSAVSIAIILRRNGEDEKECKGEVD